MSIAYVAVVMEISNKELMFFQPFPLLETMGESLREIMQYSIHPFTAPSAIPLIMNRCRLRKNRTIGRIPRTRIGNALSHWFLYCPKNLLMLKGIVCRSFA
jgi:hypothetical protein